MIDVVSPSNLTLPPTAESTTDSSSNDTNNVDIDQAIRFGQYTTTPENTSTVTDWKDLNKIYKLQIPSNLLNDPHAKTAKGERWQKQYEEIICTSVAMKLVAA